MVYCNNLPSKYDVDTASRHIDVLTYNRIEVMGWDNLTPYQKKTISYVCEKLAIFEGDNKQLLYSPVKSVGLGSITATVDFSDTSLFHRESGVIIPVDLYELLITTGLCCRII